MLERMSGWAIGWRLMFRVKDRAKALRKVEEVRRAFGRVRLSTMTEKHMTTKAESVPIFTTCAISLIGNNPATKAVSPPAIRVGRSRSE